MRRIVITGGGGFLGQRLARKLIVDSRLEFDSLVLADIVLPQTPHQDRRVSCFKGDLSDSENVSRLINSDTVLVFHLAAIVSSHAESDFTLGWRVNVDATRLILERCRFLGHTPRLVFSSTLAAFGGELPEQISHHTATTPQSSYGSQKASCELIINDYSRKGFIDGRCLRLPTVCVRPGKPNKAASSFMSSIIREPLQGETAICPVEPSLEVLLTSPDTVVENLIHAASIPTQDLPIWRTFNAPGITTSLAQMLDALQQTAGLGARALVKIQPDENIRNIVATWPSRLDNSQALSMGFRVDKDFRSILEQHLADPQE